MEKVNYQALCVDLREITMKAAHFIREEAKKFSYDQIEKKGKNDLVSYIDKESEKLLVKALSELMPEAGFITEEKTIQKLGERFNWIIDPLDGTTNFVHEIPVFSISIALQEEQEIVLGVVYEINRDELFYSWKNGGVFMNNQEIRVSKQKELSESVLATGFPYTNFEHVDAYLKLLGIMMQESQAIRRMGSAAVDLAYVACGRFGGYFEFNINSWDIAAGMFLVRQAGGIVSNFAGGGDVFGTRQMVATNGEVHQPLLNLINQYFRY